MPGTGWRDPHRTRIFPRTQRSPPWCATGCDSAARSSPRKSPITVPAWPSPAGPPDRHCRPGQEWTYHRQRSCWSLLTDFLVKRRRHRCRPEGIAPNTANTDIGLTEKFRPAHDALHKLERSTTQFFQLHLYLKLVIDTCRGNIAHVGALHHEQEIFVRQGVMLV